MTTNWGILATGRIAHTFAGALSQSHTGQLVAVGSRSRESAEKFASTWGNVTAHATYQELIDDTEIDAIYVSTPHPQHAEWTIKALNAGKAVLCEKPMALNHPEVMAMIEAAKSNGCFLMEAFMYRCHPQTAKIMEIMLSRAIGEVKHIHATFGFHAPFNRKGRLFAEDLAGGGIMDVGCYPISMVRLVAQAEPKNIRAVGSLTDTGVDSHSAALLEFENGISAHVATAVELQLDNSVRIFGTAGQINVRSPWFGGSDWSFDLISKGEHHTISGELANSYVCEIDEVDRCLEQGRIESPKMNFDDSVGNAFALDKWREQMDVVFPQERPETLRGPIHGGPLKLSKRMPSLKIKGIDKPLSRLVMGCDNQPSLSHAAVMFDAFYELGGNVFDTAHIYGGGRMETFLGQWLQARGNRSEICLIAKGAHTPMNFPEHIKPQLEISLDRLQTDDVELYFLHRDNEDVPVKEWIDALNEVITAGWVKAIGGSNWSWERIRDANVYTNTEEKVGFAAVSNQFSLAKMLSPVWAGCISANDADYKDFLVREDLVLCPWSSQARGFFTSRFDGIQHEGKSNLDNRSWSHPPDAEMKRCWFSVENIERRKRAVNLAKEKGVETINIALAYVLNQKFRTMPLIGPRFLSELGSSAKSLEIELDEEEIALLDLKN